MGVEKSRNIMQVVLFSLCCLFRGPGNSCWCIAFKTVSRSGRRRKDASDYESLHGVQKGRPCFIWRSEVGWLEWRVLLPSH